MSADTTTTTEFGTDESGPRTSETRARGTQSSPFLNPGQVSHALAYLSDNWPHQPMSPPQREAWVHVLELIQPGELVPALALCANGRFRPDAYAVLCAARNARPTTVTLWEAHEVDPASPEVAKTWLSRIRVELGPTAPARRR